MLNVSLVLHSLYVLLFIIGYVIQKPIWGLLGATPEIEQFSPIIVPAIIITIAVTLGLSVLLNFALRKKPVGTASAAFGVLTAVFCVAAFVADRLVKMLSNTFAFDRAFDELPEGMDYVDYVAVLGLHGGSVSFLDNILLILFVAGLALLICAYCVIRFGAKENNFLKG